MVTRLRKFTVKYSLIAMIIFLILVELLFKVDIFSLFIPSTWQLGGTLDRCVYTGIGILVIVFFMRNSLKEIGYSTRNLKQGMKIVAGIILIPLFLKLYNFISAILSGSGHFLSSPAEILSLIDHLALYISVGLVEETLYRAIPIAILRNNHKLDGRKLMFYCIVWSSFFFGAMHLFNMISGFDTPAQAIGRAMQAIGSGMIFGAIYWRTGSLLSSIIGHAIWDSCGILTECIYIVDGNSAAAASSNAVTGSFAASIILGALLLIVNVLVALFIMRKKKCTECGIEAPTMREKFFPELN